MEQDRSLDAEPVIGRLKRFLEQAAESGRSLRNLGVIEGLAHLYSRKREFEKAQALFRWAAEFTERERGAEHPEVAYRLVSLANLSQRLGKHEQAESSYRRAIEVLEKTEDPEAEERLASVLQSLASFYRRQQRPLEAETLLERAIDLRQAMLRRIDPDDIETAFLLRQQGHSYVQLGRYDEAEVAFLKSLAVIAAARKDGVRGDFPTGANALYSLARRYRKIGQPERAESLYRRTIALLEEAYGPEHPDVAHGHMGRVGR